MSATRTFNKILVNVNWNDGKYFEKERKKKKTKIRLFARFPSIKILSDRIFNNFRGEHPSLTLKIICYKIDVAFFLQYLAALESKFQFKYIVSPPANWEYSKLAETREKYRFCWIDIDKK